MAWHFTSLGTPVAEGLLRYIMDTHETTAIIDLSYRVITAFLDFLDRSRGLWDRLIFREI